MTNLYSASREALADDDEAQAREAAKGRFDPDEAALFARDTLGSSTERLTWAPEDKLFRLQITPLMDLRGEVPNSVFVAVVPELTADGDIVTLLRFSYHEDQEKNRLHIVQRDTRGLHNIFPVTVLADIARRAARPRPPAGAPGAAQSPADLMAAFLGGVITPTSITILGGNRWMTQAMSEEIAATLDKAVESEVVYGRSDALDTTLGGTFHVRLSLPGGAGWRMHLIETDGSGACVVTLVTAAADIQRRL